MTLAELLVWGVLLVAQTATNTWVARARNSAAFGYHALATAASNGVWFGSQILLFSQFARIRESGNAMDVAVIGAFYVLCTVAGGVSAHYVLLRWVESGRRKVGAE